MFREECVCGEPGRNPVQMDRWSLDVLFKDRGERRVLSGGEMGAKSVIRLGEGYMHNTNTGPE